MATTGLVYVRKIVTTMNSTTKTNSWKQCPSVPDSPTWGEEESYHTSSTSMNVIRMLNKYDEGDDDFSTKMFMISLYSDEGLENSATGKDKGRDC